MIYELNSIYNYIIIIYNIINVYIIFYVNV